MDSLLRSANKAHRQPRNRLLSVSLDSEWVGDVCAAFARPLIPNERCGLWYCDPDRCADSCYFKSTDGHTGQWQFSLRRLNFHLLELIAAHNGALIVDSTRRGKTMPDALSKTIPIWCAVLNYIMMSDSGLDPPENNYFFHPQQTVSTNEAHDIIQLIPSFAQRVVELGLITPQKLQKTLQNKILRPLWVHPGHSLPFEPPVYTDFHPVICCVASIRADDGARQMSYKGSQFTYVQGAADDHELWAAKLSPELYWENFEALSDGKLSNEEMEALIVELGNKHGGFNENGTGVHDVVVLIDQTLSVGTVVSGVTLSDVQGYDTVVLLSTDHDFDLAEDTKTTALKYNCPSNKKGSNELRKHLATIMSSIGTTSNTLVLCENGSDLSIGVILSILSSRYDLNWQPRDNIIVTKDVIKRQLAKVLEKKKVNPSRATLQAINTYLM